MNFPGQSIIEPFIDATLKTLTSECHLLSTAGKPFSSSPAPTDGKSETVAMVHVIASNYSVLLSFYFSEPLVIEIASRILGRKAQFNEIDQGVAIWIDSILAQLRSTWPDAKHAHRTTLHILNISRMASFHFRQESRVPAVALPFETPEGSFRVEMSVSSLKS